MSCFSSTGLIAVRILNRNKANTPVMVSILRCASTAIKVSIIHPTVQAPANPLVAHLGGGTAMFSWDTPVFANGFSNIDHYDIETALNLVGPYSLGMGAGIRATAASLYNLPLTKTLYFRVRAFDNLGNASAYTQVKVGKFLRPILHAAITSISGSRIPAGSVFCAPTVADRLIGLSPPVDLLIA